MRSPRSLSREQVAKQVQVAINGLAEPEVEYGVGRNTVFENRMIAVQP